MKNTQKLSLLAAGVLLTAVTTASAATNMAVAGKAYFKAANGKVSPLTGNQKINLGDRFTTGEKGKVTIRLNKSCLISIPPLSTVQITDFNKCPSARPINGAVANAGAAKATAVSSTGATTGGSILGATGLSTTTLGILGAAAAAGAIAIATNSDDDSASPD